MAPNQPPPSRYSGTPARWLLPEGTALTRVHSNAFGVTQFNPTVAASAREGGRFDASPPDPYAFLYAASDDAAAISEVLLRDLPINEFGARLLQRVRLTDLRISRLRATLDLDLVSLRSGRDLASIGQDSWLTTAPASEYTVTRAWASAIRAWVPEACGLAWRSHREPASFAYVFFADRCPAGCFEDASGGLPLPSGYQDLSGGAARIYVEEILAAYRVALL